VISAILAHASGGRVFRTYVRAPLAAAQREAVEEWAEMLLGP
jgi:hypothetical protein